MQPRNVRSFRYWADWHVNQKRARAADAPSPGRAAERGAARPNLGLRKHAGASRPARHFSRLEEQEASATERAETDATWRREQIAYLAGALKADFTSLIPDAPEDYTQFQLTRAAEQAHGVHQFLVALEKNARLEDRLSVHAIADHVAENNGNNFTGRSLRAWYAEYVENGGMFNLHGIGKWKRELLINEEDIARKVRKFMIGRVRKEALSVDDALSFFNDEILKPLAQTESGRATLAAHHLGDRISRSTAHRWMRAAGCKYDAAKQSYYNDKHEDADVVAYRKVYAEVSRDARARAPCAQAL
jgi:hypothetical protein